MRIEKINLRVYGLWIHAEKGLLLVDELIKGHHITKLPGGGLELGEGIYDCLAREWSEEIGLPIRAARHFYTTDFFQQSAYNPVDQIVSVYYLVDSPGDAPALGPTGEIQQFRWQHLDRLRPEHVTLPIDRRAIELFVQDRPAWPPKG
jgi:8-oxo-dGTP pyrophosphatase MutT (NUDIX family)